MKQSKQLYGQNEIAHILGVSRGTFSKWLKENSVSPKQRKGQQKLYDETVIEQYKKSKKADKNSTSKKLTTVELLQSNLKEKQQEIDYLRQQLKEKDKQIKTKDQTIADFGSRFAKLADQAQQLNLTDKDPNKVQLLHGSVSETDAKQAKTVKETADETEDQKPKRQTRFKPAKHWWNRFFKK